LGAAGFEPDCAIANLLIGLAKATFFFLFFTNNAKVFAFDDMAAARGLKARPS